MKLEKALKYFQPNNFTVETQDYNDEFETPVLTAGKSFILGYTDETEGIFDQIPAIIFDDFTTSFHYVDFPFKVKSTAMKILVPANNDVNLKYVYYHMQGVKIDTELHKRYWISRFSKQEIPLPPLKTQQEIVEILDAAAALRDHTKKLLEEYDLLAQSIFLDMFGDPVLNEKGFNIESLANYGVFKNGLNYSKNENGIEIRNLGVGDFKSKYIINDMNTLSFIHLNQMPSEGFFLKNGDLVFVRSNGNKDLVGRCLVIHPEKELVTFSGFCIRYRLSNNLLTSNFLAQLFRIKSFKQSMLKGGRGANIQNINQNILSELNVPIPPITLQNEFAEKIEIIEQQKALAKQELQESEDLFQALLQKAFKGELV